MSERSEEDGMLQSDSLRSPCSDAHYEAFIIQSKWTVDNLYASNVNLGQEYVKRIKMMERQKKTWLLGKCKEQQSIEKRMRELETAQRCASVDTLRRWRQLNPPSVKPTSRHESLDRLTARIGLTPPITKLKPPKVRSVSQPCAPTGFALNSLSESMGQLRQNNAATGRQMRPPRSCRPRVNTLPAQPQMTPSKMSVCSENEFPLRRKTFSVSTPSLRLGDSGLEEEQVINTKLIPKYVPSKLRSRKSTLF